MRHGFTFDDFLLVPAYSALERDDINISSKFFGMYMSVPILSSPMETITGRNMTHAMRQNGGMGVYHRYCDVLELKHAATLISDAIAISPSMGMDFVKEIREIYPNIVLVLDVAHGDTKRNLDFCAELVKQNANVVSGNICTWEAAGRYYDIGVKYFRVGIGSGSVCTTRLVTGVGFPQASAIKYIKDELPYNDYKIISDGGHRTTGDIVKALAMGADFVMLGGMLAGTDEAEGGTQYRGMASAQALVKRKTEFFVEGMGKNVEPKGPVSGVLKNIGDAIRQACYYTGSKNLAELKNSEKIFLTPAGYSESYSR